jgi:hypothetical protein
VVEGVIGNGFSGKLTFGNSMLAAETTEAAAAIKMALVNFIFEMDVEWMEMDGNGWMFVC